MYRFKVFLKESELDDSLKKIGQKRSKYGVGKMMEPFLYVHKDYVPEQFTELVEKLKASLPEDFEYTAVKIDTKTLDSISFIFSPDFDTADEPTVGTSYKVTTDGKVTVSKAPADPLIWHHKWEWVPDSYTGFDVEASKQRSLDWKSKLGVNKDVSNRIGRLSYWKQWIAENGL
jgi:hypothetical protein